MQDQFKRHDRHTIPEAHVALGRNDRPANLPWVDLEIVRGRAKNKLRPVAVPAFLIGSATDCDLVLGDSRFPEVHAYLLLKPTGVFIRHLGFVPEMMVNGRPITQCELADGDCLRTGPYEFRVHIRGDTDKDWTQGVHEALAPTEENEVDEDGYEEVREFLRDIRAALLPDTRSLRLYVKSDVESPRVRATPAWCAARMATGRLAWGA